jgi:hypothetical protein
MTESDILPANLRAEVGKFDAAADEIIQSIGRALNAREPPPIIYHYTNDAGLRGILESGKLWLTDIFDLNDPIIADRTIRRPASRAGNRSGSWSRLDGHTGLPSGRPPSSARSRPSSGTRGCELRNLSGWCQPGRRTVSHDILPVFEHNWRIIECFLSSVDRSSWYPWPTLARREPTRTA